MFVLCREGALIESLEHLKNNMHNYFMFINDRPMLADRSCL